MPPLCFLKMPSEEEGPPVCFLKLPSEEGSAPLCLLNMPPEQVRYRRAPLRLNTSPWEA